MPRKEDRSVSEVLQDIVANLQDIIRSEIRLARAEIKTGAGTAAQAGKPLMAGAVLAFYAGGLLLLTVVYALSLVLQPWLAALLVCGLVSLLAVVLISTGRQRLRRIDRKPVKTIHSVKEDVRWLKDQIR